MGETGAERGGRRRVLAVVGLLLTTLAALLLVLGLLGQLGRATPHMRGFHPGQTITVPESGMSVYARTDDARAGTVCRADGGGAEPTVLERPVDAFAVDVSGTPFFEIARSPASLPAGSYELTCEGTDERLYAGPRAPETVAPGLVGTAGLVLGGLLLAAAVLIGLALLATRRPAAGEHGGTAGSTRRTAVAGWPLEDRPAVYRDWPPGHRTVGAQPVVGDPWATPGLAPAPDPDATTQQVPAADRTTPLPFLPPPTGPRHEAPPPEGLRYDLPPPQERDDR